MTTHTICDTRYAVTKQAQRKQDFLLISTFGFWAAVIGLTPVLAFHLATGS